MVVEGLRFCFMTALPFFTRIYVVRILSAAAAEVNHDIEIVAVSAQVVATGLYRGLRLISLSRHCLRDWNRKRVSGTGEAIESVSDDHFVHACANRPDRD